VVTQREAAWVSRAKLSEMKTKQSQSNSMRARWRIFRRSSRRHDPILVLNMILFNFNCPLDQRWLNFAEIHYGDFRSLVATGATDDEIAEWIEKNAKKRPRAEIVAWNNKERDLRVSDLPPELQEYMENYINRYIPRNRVVYHWFDVYDLEEQRI
jgi:hypothetical protein